MIRIFMFLLGFILSVTGLFFILLYLNLLVIGYSFFEFVKFIISNVYCNIYFIGLFLIYLSMKGWAKIELLLRFFNKSSR